MAQTEKGTRKEIFYLFLILIICAPQSGPLLLVAPAETKEESLKAGGKREMKHRNRVA